MLKSKTTLGGAFFMCSHRKHHLNKLIGYIDLFLNKGYSLLSDNFLRQAFEASKSGSCMYSIGCEKKQYEGDQAISCKRIP